MSIEKLGAISNICQLGFAIWFGYETGVPDIKRKILLGCMIGFALLSAVLYYRAIAKHSQPAISIPPQSPTAIAAVSISPLSDKVHKLGCDILEFLKEKGPPPYPEIFYYDEGDFKEFQEAENTRHLLRRNNPKEAERQKDANAKWNDSVVSGFEHRFSMPVKNLIHEVVENGFDALNGGWKPLEGKDLETVEARKADKIARHLLNLSGRIEAETILGKN